MGLITVSEVIDAVGGRLIAGPALRRGKVFTGFSIDSRSVRKNDLFIAIVGKRFDGHDFVAAAVEKGAAGAVISRHCSIGNANGDLLLIMVEDTTKALQDLAAWHRRRFYCPLAAVTGTNGKTTTKDLTWGILSRRRRTLRSQGNWNNHIGVPLTLLELDEWTEAAVLELGTSAFGEIRRLVSLCSPDVGCITNIGPAHLQSFGSVRNVAKAKAELLQGMPEGSPAVLNADDDWFDWLRSRARGPVVTFGIRRPADFMAEEIHARDGVVVFRLAANLLEARRPIRLPFPGAHNAYNALAAAAISSQMGAGISQIEEGLSGALLPDMRYEVLRLSGLTVINDAYNANPASTVCALASFCEMEVPGRRIFVCGDMLELGKHARRAHREIGLFIKSKPIDYVIALGELAPEVIQAAFPRRGGGHERWECCRTVEEVVTAITKVAQPGDALLIKGSRANGMERIVEALSNGEHAAPKREGKE